jgi:hypothetical protein
VEEMSLSYTQAARPSNTTAAGARQQLEDRRIAQEQRTQQLEQQKAADDEAARKRRRTTTIVIIVVAVVVVLALGLALYFFVFRKSSGVNTTATTGGTTTGVPVGGSCPSGDASVCATGLICSGDLCKRAPQAACGTDAECPQNYVCSDGTCQGQTQSTCFANNDCLSPMTCPSGECTVPTCSSNTQCIHGGQCNGTKCLATLNGFCNATPDCAPPYICDAQTQRCVIEGNCSLTSCHNVSPINRDAIGGYCDLGASPPVCVTGHDGQCVEDTQCASDALDTPAGRLATEKCDPAADTGGFRRCHALGGTTCNPMQTSPASTSTSMCLIADTCVETTGPTTGMCSCAASADCAANGALPACASTGINANMCVQCTSDANCPGATQPTTDTHCDAVSNICTHSCTTTADCTGSSAPSCLANKFCGFCATSADCPSGQTCPFGQCACTTNVQCAAGQTCSVVTGVCS